MLALDESDQEEVMILQKSSGSKAMHNAKLNFVLMAPSAEKMFRNVWGYYDMTIYCGISEDSGPGKYCVTSDAENA